MSDRVKRLALGCQAAGTVRTRHQEGHALARARGESRCECRQHPATVELWDRRQQTVSGDKDCAFSLVDNARGLEVAVVLYRDPVDQYVLVAEIELDVRPLAGPHHLVDRIAGEGLDAVAGIA